MLIANVEHANEYQGEHGVVVPRRAARMIPLVRHAPRIRRIRERRRRRCSERGFPLLLLLMMMMIPVVMIRDVVADAFAVIVGIIIAAAAAAAAGACRGIRLARDDRRRRVSTAMMTPTAAAAVRGRRGSRRGSRRGRGNHDSRISVGWMVHDSPPTMSCSAFVPLSMMTMSTTTTTSFLHATDLSGEAGSFFFL